MDPPRDILHFINLKREEFPRPIVGVGHSMGGCHLFVFLRLLIRSKIGLRSNNCQGQSCADAPTPPSFSCIDGPGHRKA